MAESDHTNPDDTMRQVEQYVQGLVTQYLAEARQTAQQAQPQAQQSGSQQPSYEEQLKQYVNPVVDSNPTVRQAHFTAFDVKDQVDFYRAGKSADPAEEALKHAYYDQVEDAFKKLAESGRPTSRKDIYRWLVGDEYSKDPAAFNAKQSELKKAQLDRARMAGDFGSSNIGREGRADTFPSMEEFGKMPSVEQAKLLDGVTF